MMPLLRMGDVHVGLLQLGWSEDEKLIAVTEDGTVRVYEGLQADFVPFSLGHVSRIAL